MTHGADSGSGWRDAWSRRLQQSWNARGWLACSLWPLSLLFSAVTAARRMSYARGWLHADVLPVPVVVVGNLVAGGAGKTPTVICVVALLQHHGYTPGIVSRGYRRRSRQQLDVEPTTPVGVCGDEPLLLRLRTGVPVMVGRRRADVARALLLAHPGVDVIVSDDGLQHLALARTAQVLVFDERGAGNRWLLPAGPLREPLPAVVPPRTLLLYNAAAASTPLPGSVVHRSLAGAVLLADWWRGLPPSRAALDSLRGRPVIAAAGLARPQRFFEMLRGCGLQISALPLPDHFGFDALPWPAGSRDVIVTEKDAVKLDPASTGTTRVWVAALDFQADAGFVNALLRLLPRPPETAPRHGSQIA